MICKSEITALRLWPSNPNNPENKILGELFRLGFLSRAIHRSCGCRGTKEEGSGYFANRLPVTESANFLTTSRRPSVYLPERDIHAGSKHLVGSAGHYLSSCVLHGRTNEPNRFVHQSGRTIAAFGCPSAMGGSQGGSGRAAK